LLRKYRVEIAWGIFALANWVAMVVWPNWETIPFHFVFISLTLVYGFRVWKAPATTVVLSLVILVTGGAIFKDALNGSQLWGELFEVPLMSAMFLAMVWHATRREAALKEVALVADRQREFVRDASHQLKTPIAVCRALTGVIRTEEDGRQREIDLADLADELEGLGEIAERLLMLAGSHPDDLVLAPVEVEDLVVAAISRWSRRIDRNWGVHVLDDGLIDGDRTRLDGALDAILENAAAATTDGDSILVVARATGGGRVVIEIVDTGQGIAKEAAERVFDRFWSAPYQRGGKRGTGLGLAIVKAVAEAHGGTAEFSSVPGKETTVRLILPGLRRSTTPDAVPMTLALPE
jgi:two-component system, OmpR family, sensor kinase